MKKELYARWCLAHSLTLARLEAIHLKTDASPDTVHDFRVAIRRARTLLHAFKPLLGKRIPLSENSFRTINRFLGQARDAHISIMWLKKIHSHRKNLNLGSLIRELQQSERRAAQKAQEFLPRFFANEKRLAFNLPTSAFPPELRRSYIKWVRKRLIKRKKKLARLIKKVKDPKSAFMHQVRIEAKKIRYLAETLPNDAKAVRHIIKIIKHAQSALGDIHDLTRLASHLFSTRKISQDVLLAILQNEERRLFRRYEKNLRALPLTLKKELAGLY